MKILVVSQYFWPENFGINRLVNDLISLGVDVTVLTGKPNYPSGKILSGYKAWGTCMEEFRGAKIFRVPIFPRGSGSSLGLALNYLSFIVFGAGCGPWLLKGQRFDAVFVYAPSPILQVIPAMLFSKLKKAPLVVWVQDLWPQSLSATGYIKNKVILRLVNLIVCWIYRSSDLLLVQSKAFLEHVNKQVQKKIPVHFFPNSAEQNTDSNFNNPSFEAAKWIEMMRSKFSVVFTGNVGSAQSMQTVIESAALCSSNEKISIFIVGIGSEIESLKREIKDRNLNNIFLTGWLPAEDMGAIWDASSALLVLLLDKPIFHQTIPNKLQCYLSAGKPIIASLGGEGAKIVKDAKSGLVCLPEDPEALAICIKNLAAMHKEELIEFGRNGKKYFDEHFESKMLTRGLISQLSELIDSCRKKGQ
jgi:glycosyltransferase involved in cell wall biosynthesis